MKKSLRNEANSVWIKRGVYEDEKNRFKAESKDLRMEEK